MADDVNDTEASVRFWLKHTSNKILEFFRKETRLVLFMDSPEEVSPVLEDRFVELVILVGLKEGRASREQDEQDHTKCKEINSLTLI